MGARSKLSSISRLRIYTVGAEGLYVFRGFNGRLVSKSLGSTAPETKKITYDQLLRILSLWFSGVMVNPLRFSGSNLPRSPGEAAALPPRPILMSRRSFGDSMGAGSPGTRKSATWRATPNTLCRCRGRPWAFRRARRRMCRSRASPPSSRLYKRIMMVHWNWMECPRGQLFGLEEKSSVSSELTMRPWHISPRRSCRYSALHVCAHMYLTNEVLVYTWCIFMDMHASQQACWGQSRKHPFLGVSKNARAF